MTNNRKVECPNCKAIVEYRRDKRGRWVGTVVGGLGGAAAGGWVGTAMGIAALGGAIAATIPAAAVGLAALALAGYIVGRKCETAACPNCKKDITVE